MKLEEVRQMENILISFLGEPKARFDNEIEGQRIFNCPRCAEENGGRPDGKYNLEINLSKNLSRGGVFQCWRCSAVDGTMKGGVLKLVKKYGGLNAYTSYRELINSIRNSKLYDIDEFGGDIENEVETPQIKLPASFKKINLKTCRNSSLKQYLKQRCIDQWTINKFNIGYTEKDDNGFSYRIIVPSYNDLGQLNYFVGRDYLPADTEKDFKRVKYKNCDVDKKTIVFQESLIDFDSDVVLVEGALDCIYGPNTISMLGKFLTPDSALFSALVERAKAKVIICLDNDTKVSETLKICRLLEDTKLSGRVYYIQMNEYKDFGEAFEKDGVDGIIKCIRSAVKYDKDKDF